MLIDVLAPYVKGGVTAGRTSNASMSDATNRVVHALEAFEGPDRPDAFMYNEASVAEVVHAVICGKPTLPDRSVPSVYAEMRVLAGVRGLPERVLSDAHKHVQEALVVAIDPLHAEAQDPGEWLCRMVKLWNELMQRLCMVQDMLRPVVVCANETDFDAACMNMLTRTCRATQSITVWEQGLYQVAEAARLGVSASQVDLRSLSAPKYLERALEIVRRVGTKVEPVVDEAHSFYRSYALQLYSGRANPPEIAHSMPVIHNWIMREQAWASWLGPDASVVDVVQDVIVRPHQDILSSAWPYLMETSEGTVGHAGPIPNFDSASAAAELRACYAVFDAACILPRLYEAMREYIQARVCALLQKTSDDILIEHLITSQRTWHRLWWSCLQANTSMRHAIQDGFEAGLRGQSAHIAELLANYIDAELQKGRGLVDSSMPEACMDDVLFLFRCLHHKDLFEEYYQRAFARRLLLRCSASDDAERAVILRLKHECGPDYTRKLETMLKDMHLSDNLRSAFAEAGGASTPFEFEVDVLTQAHWPPFHDVPLILSSSMQSALLRYETFYHTCHSGRSLHWCHALGSMLVRADLGEAGVKDLVVSTLQAAVLLVFNAREVQTFSELEQATHMPLHELQRTLQSLACGPARTRILRKIPPGGEVRESDSFMVNEQLSNARRRIKLNQLQQRDSPEERRTSTEHVLMDRDVLLQASAMRVLKAHKLISHADLTTAVIEQVKSRFPVETAELKRAFERLIEKDCMERVDGDRQVYRYVA